MTSPVSVQLIVADLALIKGVIMTLAQISGDDAVALNDVLTTVQPVLTANAVTSLDPALRDSKVGQAAVAVDFSQQAAVLVRGQLLARVKAFTAADIPQVLRIRAAFDTALSVLADAQTKPI
jgi:hypothetical protein